MKIFIENPSEINQIGMVWDQKYFKKTVHLVYGCPLRRHANYLLNVISLKLTSRSIQSQNQNNSFFFFKFSRQNTEYSGRN